MRLGLLPPILILAAIQDPPAKRMDRYGDPLPPGATARLGSSRFLHDSLTMSLAYSKDGSRLLTGGYDHTIRIWDAATGRRLALFMGHKDSVETVAFSSTEEEIVSRCRDGEVRIWNVKEGTHRAFASAGTKTTSAVLSPDGKQLALGDAEGCVRLIDPSNGETRKEIKSHDGKVFALLFGADGKGLTSAGADGFVKGWTLATGKETWRNQVHSAAATRLAASPAGRVLASGGDDRTLSILESATGNVECRLEAHEQPISFLAFSQDGTDLVSGDQGGELIRWDLTLRKPQWRARGAAYSAAWHPNGKILAAGGSVIRHFEGDTGKRIEVREGHEGWIEWLQYAPDGRRLMSTSRDGTVRIWDPKSAALLFTIEAGSGWSQAAAYSHDGREIVSMGRDKLSFWNAQTGALNRELSFAMHHRAGGISYSREGDKLLFGGTYVQLLESATGAVVRSARTLANGGSVDTADALALSPDGKTVLTGHYSKVLRSWNAETLEETGKFVGHLGRPGMSECAIAFSPDGRLVASSDGDEKTMRLWEAATAKPLGTFEGHGEPAHSVAFSPDGLWVASGSLDGTARLWEVATGKEVLRLLDDKIWKWIGSVAFSPNGRQLATGLNGTILTWSLRPEGLKDDRSLEELWKDLASPEAPRAYRAIWSLADRGEMAAGELAARLAASAPDGDRVRQLIVNLGADSIEERDRAARDLLAAAIQSEPVILEALKEELPAEVRARLSQLLTEMDAALSRSLEILQRVRALHAIERAGAQEALKTVAERGSFQRLRREAAAALKRMGMK